MPGPNFPTVFKKKEKGKKKGRKKKKGWFKVSWWGKKGRQVRSVFFSFFFRFLFFVSVVVVRASARLTPFVAISAHTRCVAERGGE